MSFFERQILAARRRLAGNVLFEHLALGVLAAATLWGLAIVIVRLFALPMPLWHAGWVAALAALVVGLVGLSLRRPSHLQAAVALDQAAGLKERLSTAWSLRASGDPFVRAAIHDAEQAAGRVHVPSHIRYQAPRLWPWSSAVAVAALLLAWFMPVVDLLASEPTDEQQLVPREVVEAERQFIKAEFEAQVNELKTLADRDPELQSVLEDLQPLEMPDHPNVRPEDVRREAVRRLEDLRDRLQQRLESPDSEALKQTKRMFQQLNQPGQNQPDDKLSQSLAQGDFKGAQEALREMSQQIQESAKSAQDPEARKKLEDMQQRLEQLADQLAKLGENKELQNELQKSGLSEEAARKLLEQLANADPKQLEKELQKRLGEKGMSEQQIQELAQKIRQQQKKLQQQQQARKQAQNLSNALKQAAQGCQQCQQPGGSGEGSQQSADAMADAMSQLSDLEMAEQLMNDLESQLSDMENRRDNICQGGQCPGGDQFGKGGLPGQIGQQGPNAGLGLGERIGREKVAYGRDPTKAPTRYEGGTIIGRMLVEGPQVRGEASAEEVAADASAVRDALDAVERENVPRQYQRVTQTYFERLAGLLRARHLAADKPADNDNAGDADNAADSGSKEE